MGFGGWIQNIDLQAKQAKTDKVKTFKPNHTLATGNASAQDKNFVGFLQLWNVSGKRAYFPILRLNIQSNSHPHYVAHVRLISFIWFL